jgi:hypothetical protein
MTKEELVTQCLTENPVMIQTINDVERELSEEERITAANAWADMRLAQIAYQEKLAEQTVLAEAEAEAKATAKAALLTRLGITAEEAQLLLGGN